ncbi:MAG: hypothetical protein ACI95C_000555 [Pseudohongiellaceae bacterium]
MTDVFLYAILKRCRYTHYRNKLGSNICSQIFDETVIDYLLLITCKENIRIETAMSISIDQKLIEEGTAQLSSEIEVLEAWLRELETKTDEDNEIIAARKSYNDMLRSRREMLSSLAKQSKLQAVSAD